MSAAGGKIAQDNRRAVWRGMLARCRDSRHTNFANYGGRGIAVCERWLTSFANFAEDMGPRPLGYTIDRIDCDGNYTPDNCRWADNLTQQNNRTNNRRVDAGGKCQTVAEWARELGIPRETLSSRLWRGIPPERALSPTGGLFLPHGTNNRYLRGCRCEPCRAARSAYCKLRKANARFIPITDHDQPPGREAEPFSPKGGSALVSGECV